MRVPSPLVASERQGGIEEEHSLSLPRVERIARSRERECAALQVGNQSRPTSIGVAVTTAAGVQVRDLLDGEIFYTLKEAKVLIERWRQQYNRLRPHSSLGHRPPAPEATWLKPATLRSADFNELLSAPSYVESRRSAVV